MATTPKTTTRDMGLALTKVLDAVGKAIHLETVDGSYREGRLSGLETRAVSLNGQLIDWPLALELNGDPGDLINFEHIKALQIE